MPRDLPFTQVDAFTDRPFAGNPAAVFVLERPRPSRWMRAVAREMNLSETAFLHPRGADWGLRWFTPAVEVPLCGHATLASAHVLWETRRLGPGEPARFRTKSGLLVARRRGALIELDLPARPLRPARIPCALARALGARPTRASRCGWSLLVELSDERVLRRLRPDFSALRELPFADVIVTARSRAGAFDFVSRCFAPREGVDEDPVTGSAHCALGPYWRERLGKTAFTAFQASSRGGVLEVEVRGDRVLVAGAAVTVLRGRLTA